MAVHGRGVFLLSSKTIIMLFSANCHLRSSTKQTTKTSPPSCPLSIEIENSSKEEAINHCGRTAAHRERALSGLYSTSCFRMPELTTITSQKIRAQNALNLQKINLRVQRWNFFIKLSTVDSAKRNTKIPLTV